MHMVFREWCDAPMEAVAGPFVTYDEARQEAKNLYEKESGTYAVGEMLARVGVMPKPRDVQVAAWTDRLDKGE